MKIEILDWEEGFEVYKQQHGEYPKPCRVVIRKNGYATHMFGQSGCSKEHLETAKSIVRLYDDVNLDVRTYWTTITFNNEGYNYTIPTAFIKTEDGCDTPIEKEDSCKSPSKEAVYGVVEKEESLLPMMKDLIILFSFILNFVFLWRIILENY